MTLSLLLLTVDQHLARANALKNMLIGATLVTSALIFIIFGPVDWAAGSNRDSRGISPRLLLSGRSRQTSAERAWVLISDST
jgi:hypothetical protein